ncbi:hypothetical protein EJ04DRAFT_515923 [Polyplosphaeria fusca]|uniref:GH16 domain-containing protein n=1 Tax=Polyplosphaeria fusca TaxID=682080 RepID=A0A9P4QR43_9PLEO|nr:hypothetical protein EJ04DRAFT_515923 [Polyplosphaeria fusca]
MYPPGEKAEAQSTVAPSSPSPPYSDAVNYARKEPSRYSPRNWKRRTWIVISVVVVVIVVGAIVGGILGAKATAYPDYYRIDYQLTDSYEGRNFFDQFEYFTGDDPTKGAIVYTNASYSDKLNLTQVTWTNTAILRVDTNDKNATSGRRSVRITSKKTYDRGLFIFDVLHAPYGCATWPALWLTDANNWPDNGEIDVIETINNAASGNRVALHTTKGCEIGKHRKRKQIGRALSHDCYNATKGNQGCAVQGPPWSAGEQFNANGGGVYAAELRTEGIRVWFFARADIPSDIKDAPDPSTWPDPLADFPNLECDITDHFKNQSIVANIDLCGWAGQRGVYPSEVCTESCGDWVAFKGESFDEAYWEFNGFWVYYGEEAKEIP